MEKITITESTSRYLAELAHDMRAPMHSILGFTHMLSENCKTPQDAEWLDNIRHAGQHLLELINDVIDIDQLNQKTIKLAHELVDIDDLVRLIVNGLQPQAIVGQLCIQYEIAHDCPHFWYGDKRKIKQVLINLISNAIKFTPPQGLVHVHLSEVANKLRISVKDTGVGINTDALTQLFTPYFHDESTKNPQGVGIGLAITRRLIELMHGEILVNSQPDDGCEFIIVLPLTKGDENVVDVTNNEAMAILQSPTSVLLVDDDQLHHQVFRGMVQHLPITVHSALTGEQALALCSTIDATIILIDYRLSDMDGLTLAKALRHCHSHNKQQPIHLVMLTAHTGNELQTALLDGTIDALLNKPLNINALISLANRYQSLTHEQNARVVQTTNSESPRNSLPSYLQALMPEFYQEIYDGISRCQQYLTDNQFTPLSGLAHRLKGQSMVFQQADFIQIFDQLENHANAKHHDECLSTLNQALTHYSQERNYK
ncbi:MAG: response regulator [Thiotrichales bacterium]|jgi:CheY-like chemotaxis protein/anti-sigma regulatory factor (Ser/Thr protein kinase)|nr:response regulator [Thiotrichales bacterium]